jgi:hypothetical protein
MGSVLTQALPVIGGLLGSAILGPEVLAPALGLEAGGTAAGALGAGLGSTIGGLAGGEKPLQALEGGAISGGTDALAQGLTNNWSSLFGGGNAAGTAAGATTSPSTATPTATPASAPSAAGGVGGSLTGAAGTAAPASVPLSSPDVTLSGGGTNLSTGSVGSGVSDGGGASSGGGSWLSRNVTDPISNLFNGSSGANAGPSYSVNAPIGQQVAADVASAPSTPIQTIQAAAPGAASGGGGGASSGGGIGSFLGKNANWLLPAAGLGYEALSQTPPKGTNALTSEANQLAGQGQQLQSYLNTGTLPPGAQNSLNQAAQQAEAAIRSQYAARGMSGSSAEAQDLANVAQTTAAQGQQLAMQLLQQGVTETNLSSELYTQLMQQQMQQDQQLSGAITNFATAAAGGGGGNTFKIVGA